MFFTHKRYAARQAELLPRFIGAGTLLDFGCGDLSLAALLHKKFPKLRITGVDVVDPGTRVSGVRFVRYDGRTLPFRNKTFDTTISYHVLHHCENPKAALTEVARVTKKQILIVEPIYRNKTDLFFMKILDRLFNSWRNVTIPMPFTFQTEETWKRWIRTLGWRVQEVKHVGPFPGFLPIGVTKLFVLSRS